MRHEQRNITCIVAERPEDPYFEVIVPPTYKCEYMYFERGAYVQNAGGYANVAEHSWDGLNPFTGTGMADKTKFSGFSGTMAAKTWHRSDFYMILIDDNSVDTDFFYVYQKRN